jgi:hypothetical protein
VREHHDEVEVQDSRDLDFVGFLSSTSKEFLRLIETCISSLAELHIDWRVSSLFTIGQQTTDSFHPRINSEWNGTK